MILSIAYTRHHRLLSLVAIAEVFETVNQFYFTENKPAPFEIRLVGENSGENLPDGLSQYTYLTISEASENDGIIIVPAFKDYEMQKNLEANLAFIPWLASRYLRGAKLASCCTGSFLLGASGLLNKKDATTHIEACEAFGKIFPEVNLIPHAIITQSHNIYTSGGATSTFHLLIMLIQEVCGRDYAVRLAKNFAIDMNRNNQLYFEKFNPGLSTDDNLVRAVQIIISERYRDLKNVEEALDTIPASRRNIVRRFKTVTGMTPIRYLQKTKIESAKSLLETTDKDILDIMLSSGYTDLKNFRELFKSFTGLTPRGYREKYAMGLQA